MVGILWGGGLDCAKLIQTTATDTTTAPETTATTTAPETTATTTATATTKTGKWMRISEFRTWIDATIRKELAPGKKTLI